MLIIGYTFGPMFNNFLWLYFECTMSSCSRIVMITNHLSINFHSFSLTKNPVKNLEISLKYHLVNNIKQKCHESTKNIINPKRFF